MYSTVYVYLISFVSCTLSSFNDICEQDYIVSSHALTRPQAQLYCKKRGLQLMTFKNMEEVERINDILHNYGQKHAYYWVDGTRFWRRDKTLWWNDSDGSFMTFTNWCTDKGQPEQKDGDTPHLTSCVALNYRGDSNCWHDYACLDKFPFICGKRCELIIPGVTMGEFCFHNAEPKTALQAEAACQSTSYGKTLLMMNNMIKYGRVHTNMKRFGKGGQSYWTSLKRVSYDRDEWAWNFGRGPALTWSNWAFPKPYPAASDCVIVIRFLNDTALAFEARACNERYSYICE